MISVVAGEQGAALVIDQLKIANLVDDERLERGVEELRASAIAPTIIGRTEVICSQPTPAGTFSRLMSRPANRRLRRSACSQMSVRTCTA